MRAAVLAIAGTMAATGATAKTICYTPAGLPYCLEDFGPFDDDIARDMCRRDLNQYLYEIAELATCLRGVDNPKALADAEAADWDAIDAERLYDCRVEDDIC